MNPRASVVQLRHGGAGLVLAFPDDRLPTVLHWGADLGEGLDADALLAALEPPVPHSAPDVPVRHRVLPMPVDGWRLRPGLRGSRLDGRHASPCFTIHSTDVGADRVLLEASDAGAGLRLRLSLTLHPSGLLQIDQALTNEGPDPYGVLELAAGLPLPARAGELLDLTGRWTLERVPQRQPLHFGTWVRESRHGRTGHDAPLILAAGTPSFGFRTGEVWAAHLAWSGDSSYWAERSPSGVGQLAAAELLSPGELVLGQGRTYEAPTFYAAYSGDGLDGIAAAFHRFVRARPEHPRTPRPVILNTWEAVYFDHDLERLTRLADTAAAVGVERFVLDDGWFADRRHDKAGLGDWFVSPDVWPAGLDPLIKHVRALGMDFGLWVEPEMINPDSHLFREHPEWILAVEGRTPLSWRHQHLLDLAVPEVSERILSGLDDVLLNHDIAYLKWDHNRDVIDPQHAGRSGVHAQTHAVYALLDELRRRHPGVEIESCASGGGRVDLGVLERTDRVWASDSNDALDRQMIQRWTAQLLPLELIGAHVGAPVSHTSGRAHTLSFRVATALFGHFGIEWDLAAASVEEREGLREAIAYYKAVRSLLHEGDLVRADSPDPTAAVHGCVSSDGSDALFAYVQLVSSVSETPGRVCLPGLDDNRRYHVSAVPLAGGPVTHHVQPPGWLAEGVDLAGRTLSGVGITMPILAPAQALLLRVTAI